MCYSRSNQLLFSVRFFESVKSNCFLFGFGFEGPESDEESDRVAQRYSQGPSPPVRDRPLRGRPEEGPRRLPGAGVVTVRVTVRLQDVVVAPIGAEECSYVCPQSARFRFVESSVQSIPRFVVGIR